MTFEQIQEQQRLIEAGMRSFISLVKLDDPVEIEVVWSGGELLPPREQKPDQVLASLPSMDWDEDSVPEVVKEKRKYTRTGRYAVVAFNETQGRTEGNGDGNG